MLGTAYEFFQRQFGCKVFVIRLLYRTFKEKLKIQGRHPFKLGNRNGVKIIDFRRFAGLFLSDHAELN